MAAFSEMDTRVRLIKKFTSYEAGMITLTLTRPAFVNSNSGGRVRDEGNDLILPAQPFGIMPFKRRPVVERKLNTQTFGRDETEDADYTLIGMPVNNIGITPSDIEQLDEFEWTEDQWLQPGPYYVLFVQSRQHDHVLAGIKYRGPRVAEDE